MKVTKLKDIRGLIKLKVTDLGGSLGKSPAEEADGVSQA